MRMTVSMGLCLLLASCGTAPRMERSVMVWNGSSEAGGAICKFPTDAMKQMLKDNPQYEMFLKDPTAIVCLKATDKKFNEYGAMTFDDIETIQRYIEKLTNSCRVWK